MTINSVAFHSNERIKKCKEPTQSNCKNFNTYYSPLVLVELENGDGKWIKARFFLDTGNQLTAYSYGIDEAV